MRVKRLEVQGFKSFKDKTVIHFDHTITGIVGPNGCGKSNIVDAFFWVMGEQSYKHMRGSGAEDLIFNGSSKYAPLAHAEATLVLETDVADTANAPAGASVQDLPVHLRSKEIAVTRRVYREGGGEYFINGVQARLKDIHELFMDTGIGAKGYSIIEQGQIGKVVNAKPEERRLLIEEAAGIAKYKARKKESLRKMEAAQGNLSRLNDVIQEIERTLNSLERQAQKASQHRKLKDELLEKEMTWGRRRNRVLRQRLDDLRSKRDTLEQELVGLRAELSTAEASVETDRVEQLDLTKNAEELQHVIGEMSHELTRAQSALDLSRRRQSDLTAQLDTLESEREDLQTAIGSEKEKIVSLESENENAGAEFEAHAGRSAEKDARVRELRRETDEARRQLDQLKRDVMKAINETSEFTRRAAALDSRAESIKSQIGRLESQAAQLAERVEAAREELETARSQLATAQESRTQLHTETQTISEEVRTKDGELREARRALENQNREVTKLRSRLQSLEELAAAHEGFGDGPKAILDWARSSGNESSLKALADGIEVQPGYETALEGWLEGRLENFAADDSTFALQALRELAKGQSGRAAIYVSANSPRSYGSSAEVISRLSEAGFAVEGELMKFVTLNGRLGTAGQAAAEALLSGVLMVENMDALGNLLSGPHGSNLSAVLDGYALIARDGTALDRDGALRGGTTQSDNSASLLGRKRAIAELQTQVTAAEETFSGEEARVSSMTQSLELAQAKLASLRSELQASEIETAKLERDVQQLSRSLKDLESSRELSDYELSELQSDQTQTLSEREELEESLKSVTEARAELEARLGEHDAIVTQKESTLREEENEYHQLQVLEAQLKERANSVKRELESGRNLIRDRERRLADVERALDRAQNESEEHSGGDSEFILKIEELTKALGERREVLSGVKDRLEITTAKVNGALNRIKTLHSDGDHKTKEVNQFALDIERVTSDLNHLLQNLEEKYGAGCIDLPSVSPIQEEMEAPVVTVEMSAEEEAILSQDVERLRERIRRLGDVNPTAVEEYEEKKKRYDYLMTEKGDLEKSIADLMQAIEHINVTSEERFKKAFEAIADRFERLFPIIFGGGQAKISLVYPEGSEDILEAGVEILAQPPGKKVVNIGLLSGGEKALTAVSLIFAIFMVKPSPFCILDEVDAPLDDSNVGKFNALLREMSAKSQFIIITHNKKTMELNDTLYGVTMEEPGVSKMVSIEMH